MFKNNLYKFNVIKYYKKDSELRKILDIKKIKWLKYRVLYKNSYYNRYDIKIYKSFIPIPLKERKKQLKIELGTIIFINDFPFKDKNEKEPFYRKHYFMYLGQNNKDSKVYLAYITTKIDKYKKNRKKQNNYLLIKDLIKDKNIIISLKKIYEIDKAWFYKQFHLKHAYVNKKLNPLLMPYIKTMIKQAEHFSKWFKNNTKKSLIIDRQKCYYSLTIKEGKERYYSEKTDITRKLKAGTFEQIINLISNY